MFWLSNMVKLQKQLAYQYKERKHFKHLVIIPGEALEKVGWKPGEELEWTVSNNSLVLKSTTNTVQEQTQTASTGEA